MFCLQQHQNLRVGYTRYTFSNLRVFKSSSFSPAGCCWTWSHGSDKPGTTSALSDAPQPDGPQRKMRREGLGRDGGGGEG